MHETIELHRAYKRIFDTEDGRTVLEDLKQRACFDRTTFSTDPGRTLFNEGRRSMVLHVRFMSNEDNFRELSKEKK
ncbi:hypothetical protein [Salidesulfovibrio onnuriiensis]|uniref:Bbp19 family protein n=1 Tax=Salidesulfovibrio onnuriiensis TaxID=2583823 RepID=UPI0011C8C783|nr:hypothetical protein [Salidesulfovibrio onnuriiensis]